MIPLFAAHVSYFPQLSLYKLQIYGVERHCYIIARFSLIYSFRMPIHIVRHIAESYHRILQDVDAHTDVTVTHVKVYASPVYIVTVCACLNVCDKYHSMDDHSLG